MPSRVRRANPAAVRGQLATAQAGQVRAGHPDGALVGVVERADQVQERRLAGSRRAAHGDCRTLRDAERDVVERRDRDALARPEATDHALEFDHRLTCRHVHRNNA